MNRLTIDFNAIFNMMDPTVVIYAVGAVTLWALLCATVLWIVRGGQ